MAIIVDGHELTYLDEQVMWELTRSRTTVSVVSLAAGMWQSEKPGAMGADPAGLVQNIVETLAERGLCTYREEKVYAGVQEAFYDEGGKRRLRAIYQGLAHTIRLTRRGWEAMGYDTYHLEAGTRAAQRAHLHGPDPTNYRNHRETAVGEEVITETFEVHYWLFPHHVHDYGKDWIVMPDDKTRRYIRVTEDIEAQVLAYKTRHPEANYEEIAENTVLPVRTVKYIITELPRLRALRTEEGPNGSLKERLLMALDVMNFNNVTDIRRLLGRADTSHDIVHVLHNLKAEGKVTFREAAGRDHPADIRLTRRGDTAVTAIEEKKELAATNGIEKSETPTGVIVADPYPLLRELIKREYDRAGADTKQEGYLKAAEALKGIDDVEADLLIRKAERHDIPFNSPLETEYLLFWRYHTTEEEQQNA